MRVAIIGGHGKVALHLARMLSAQGHDVTGIIRNPDHATDVVAAGAVPLVGDVEQLGVDELAQHLAGHDSLVWSAGAGGGDPDRTRAVDRDAAIRSVDAAAVAGVERYVMVSYFGAGVDHGVPPESSFFPYAEAKAAADAHVRQSPLAWTILGPSALTDEPGTGSIEVGDELEGSEVPREDVAAVAVAVLDDPSTIGATIEFNAGSVPIADAVRSRS